MLKAREARKGRRLLGSNLIVTELHPCNVCAQAIIQAGIKRVYAPRSNTNSRWDERSEIARTMFSEAGIIVEYYNIPSFDDLFFSACLDWGDLVSPENREAWRFFFDRGVRAAFHRKAESTAPMVEIPGVYK